MVRYFGPDNGSAYVMLPTGRPAVGRVAEVYSDEDGTVLADILDGDRNTPGDPVDSVVVDSMGRLNFWFPDEQPVVWVTVNNGPLQRVTADLQDQLDDAIIDGGGGGGVTEGYVSAAIATHSADTTAVHGIPDTALLETQAGAQAKATAAQGAAVSTASADATTKASAAQANAATDATTKANTAQSSAVATAAADATSKANAAQSAAVTTAGAYTDSTVAAHVVAADPHGDRAYTDAGLTTKADLVGGVVPTAQIPAIAITEFLGNVANQAAMLALSGQKGDWAIRTDTGSAWIITGNNPALLADWTALPTAGAPVTSVNGQTGVVVLAKGDVGLGSVDNTSDAGKPVSTAQQTALDLKANLASPTFTGTVAGVTKAMVGLGSVDNTTDAGKPVSTAQQTALNLKANLASPTFTGTVAGITAAMVGLGSVNNTSDASKPVSTAQQAALDLKANLASPTLTGTPAAPTASAATNTTQLATTAFVQTAAGLLVPRGLVDAKGDLLIGTANDTVARLPVGSNGQVLTADSAVTEGVKWATPSGGGGSSRLPLSINPPAGRWQPIPPGRVGSNYTPTINRLYLIPMPLGATRTLTGIQFNQVTAAGAGGLARAMVLTSDSFEWPTTASFDYGTQVTTSTGNVQWTSMTDPLAAGMWWIGINFTVAAAAVRAVDSYSPYVSLAAPDTGTTAVGMYVMNGVTGALGGTPFTYFDIDPPIRICVRFS